MKKTCYLFFLLVCSCFQLSFGQKDTLSCYLYSTTGFFGEVGKYSVSCSIGELAVQTFSGSGYYLNEGFQQGEFSLKSDVDSSYHIEVNPNPVDQYLFVDFFINDERNYRVEVISMNGSKIFTYNFSSIIYGQRITLDLGQVARGLYFVNITSLDGQVFKIYKILKI